jgi:hypothetical protein
MTNVASKVPVMGRLGEVPTCVTTIVHVSEASTACARPLWYEK